MANTETTEEVLGGVYLPEGKTHQGTLELFEEILQLRESIPENSVDCLMKHSLWHMKWKKK